MQSMYVRKVTLFFFYLLFLFNLAIYYYFKQKGVEYYILSICVCLIYKIRNYFFIYVLEWCPQFAAVCWGEMEGKN